MGRRVKAELITVESVCGDPSENLQLPVLFILTFLLLTSRGCCISPFLLLAVSGEEEEEEEGDHIIHR